MNVYVIYRFDDSVEVDKAIDACKQKDKAEKVLHIFRYKKGELGTNWHGKAKRKIRDSNVVCYFYKSHNGSGSDMRNVIWELKQAEKYRKKVFIFNLNGADKLDDNKETKALFGMDYSGELLNVSDYTVLTPDKMYDALINESRWSVENSLFNPNWAKTEGEYYQRLLEEYKIMVDTSEKLMERRQNMSNLYTTLCSALVAFIGASFAFGSMLTSILIMLLSGVTIIFLSINWYNCLMSYDKSNGGKFKVINAIEKILPANMFDCEYRFNTKNGIRSYSSRERKLPFIFITFSGLTIAVATVLTFLYAFGIIA